jgi:hypothetical protein
MTHDDREMVVVEKRLVKVEHVKILVLYTRGENTDDNNSGRR